MVSFIVGRCTLVCVAHFENSVVDILRALLEALFNHGESGSFLKDVVIVKPRLLEETICICMEIY